MKQLLYLLLNIPLFVTTTREDSRVGFIKFLRFIKFIRYIKRPSDKIKGLSNNKMLAVLFFSFPI